MIPYGRQSINDDDINAVVAALKSDFLTTGPLVEIFEEKLESVVGAPCVVVSSGTAALHCAYAAIQLQPGDEVITPPLTFIATQATAAMFGAKIVFADIQSDTGNIDPSAVAAAITSKTKAIVAVDYAGHPADLDELRLLADKHGIYLIEDAAHALGSTYKGKPVGSIADITTFSFFPTKNMTTGEGGAVSSRHEDLLNRARKFARQGLIREPNNFIIQDEGPWHQEVHEFGLNYRLPDVLCALGVSQLGNLENFKKRRTTIFEYYNSNFENVRNLTIPTRRQYVDPMWHLYSIHVPETIRKSLYQYLRDHGVGVQVNYLPAHLHPVFANAKEYISNLNNSESFYRSQLSLPMSAALTDEELEYIVLRVKEFLK